MSAAHRRARAAARRRRLRPDYPLSAPPRALQARVADIPAAYLESWKGLITAAAALVRPRSSSAVAEIVISPMSSEWLKEHDITRPKQGNDT